MKSLVSAIWLASCFTLCGCATPAALRHNTVEQGDTVADLHQQQVLDNLAKFVADPYAIPSFALAASGTATINDQCNGSAAPTWNFPGADSLGLSFGLQRQKNNAWTVTPITDPRKLELMRCAYQRAASSCTGVGESNCCPDCRKRFNKFYTGREVLKVTEVTGGKEVQKYTCGPDGRLANLVPAPCEDPAICQDCLGSSGPCKIPLVKDADGNPMATGQGKVTSECLSAEGCWFCRGCKKCVPKQCGYVGHYCGTYIWVPPGQGRDELAKLTLAILDYAVHEDATLPNKEVIAYVKPDGTPANEATAAFVVKSVIGAEERNASVLDSEKVAIAEKKRNLINKYGGPTGYSESAKSSKEIQDFETEIQPIETAPPLRPLPQQRTPMPNTNLLYLQQQLDTLR
jgi:hypothetical protein